MRSPRSSEGRAATRSSPATSARRCSQPPVSTPTHDFPCSTAGTNLPRMARSWAERLGEEDARPETGGGGGGVLAGLRDPAGRRRRALTEQIGLATFDAGDEASWERLEEALIAA